MVAPSLHRFCYETIHRVTLPFQKLVFFGNESLPNLNYASSPSLNPFKSEGGQGKEDMDKMMEECMKEMETSMAKMKEMHEKMHKGEIQVDAAKMKKLRSSIFTI